MKECTHCHGPLGLGVVRAFFKLFCSVRCRDTYRAALFERAKGQLGLLADIASAQQHPEEARRK